MKYLVKNGRVVAIGRRRVAEPAGLVPMQNAYQGPAFGGDAAYSANPALSGDTQGPVDLRGMTDWITIASYDTREFKTGVVSAEVTAKQSASVTPSSFTYDLHAEVRVLGNSAGNAYVLTQSSLAKHVDLAERFSTGAFRFQIQEWQMPDRIEIQARARRGGAAENASDTGISDEILQFSSWVRFFK